MSNPNPSPKTRIKKGQVLNPTGRPVGSVSIVARLKKIFEEEPENFEKYCRDILADPTMRKSVLEQIDSKPKQPIDLDLKLPQTLIDIIKNASNQGTSKDIQPENQG